MSKIMERGELAPRPGGMTGKIYDFLIQSPYEWKTSRHIVPAIDLPRLRKDATKYRDETKRVQTSLQYGVRRGFFVVRYPKRRNMEKGPPQEYRIAPYSVFLERQTRPGSIPPIKGLRPALVDKEPTLKVLATRVLEGHQAAPAEIKTTRDCPRSVPSRTEQMPTKQTDKFVLTLNRSALRGFAVGVMIGAVLGAVAMTVLP